MSHITTCQRCGCAYEDSSEENANAPEGRRCGSCLEIEKNGTGVDWRELYRRVSTGQATVADARPVEQIGLLPQAIRIRSGLADHHDALLIALQVELTGEVAA